MKSIRSQLLGWLLPSFVIIFALAITGVYYIAKRATEAELDARLGRLSGSARIALRNHFENSTLSFRSPGLRSFLSKEEFQSPGHYFELWNEYDETIRRSASLENEHLPRPDRYTRDGVKYDATLWNGDLVRVNTMQIPKSGGESSLRFSIAISKAEERERLHRFLIQAIVGGLGCCLLVCLSLICALHSALRPLAHLGEQVSSIDAGSLKERFKEESLPFEISPLVVKLNELMERLQAGFERERRFSGDLAHELRTPLAAIRSTSEVASRWPEQSSVEDFGDIANAAARMQHILDTLLLLSRLELAASADAFVEVPLLSMINEILGGYKPTIGDRKLEVILEVNKTYEICTVPELFRIILNNLISNAVQYAPVGSSIKITARDDDPFFCITNLAPHLSEEDLSCIFDRLWRKDSSRSDTNHAGLGLSLARNCADFMGLALSASLDSEGYLLMSLFRQKG